jgi:UDP-galactopyranose mutase
MINKCDILIVGCGLSGVVMAERFANVLNKKVLIIEKREHVGGNIYDYIDEKTNILMNKYGAHLFHTNNEKVFEYINKFGKWVRWDHRVVGNIKGTLFPIPVNINTINTLCEENISNTEEMNEWLKKNQVKYESINNSEEMGKSRVGNILYEKIFKDYTFKQWNKYPEELDASVLARIPIINNFDDRYFNDKYQVLPELGYTKFIESILKNDNISVSLNTNYFDYIKTNNLSDFETIIYTGPIDAYYSENGYEKLEYRSIDFEIERYIDMNYYQTNSVVNYPEINTPYTRIVEYKHFLNQQSKDTIIVKETTSDHGEPYYPVPNKKNLELYEKYKKLSLNEKNVHFLGRLANYKYFNMDTAILNSLEYFEENFLTNIKYNN